MEKQNFLLIDYTQSIPNVVIDYANSLLTKLQTSGIKDNDLSCVRVTKDNHHQYYLLVDVAPECNIDEQVVSYFLGDVDEIVMKDGGEIVISLKKYEQHRLFEEVNQLRQEVGALTELVLKQTVLINKLAYKRYQY